MCVTAPNKIFFPLFTLVVPVQMVKVLFAEKTMKMFLSLGGYYERLNSKTHLLYRFSCFAVIIAIML